MIVSGIDEAGRGSMIGPLVVAGVSMKQASLKTLATLDVKDSKKLTPSRRETLYRDITKLAEDYQILRINPRTIDRRVSLHQLNRLEAEYMAKIIGKLGLHSTYVDACSANSQKFGAEVARLSGNKNIHSHHHADERFIVVAAASILAKVARDRSIAVLQRKHDVGSGYPSDDQTVHFVKQCISSRQNIPSFVRKSWEPVRRLVDAAAQTALTEF